MTPWFSGADGRFGQSGSLVLSHFQRGRESASVSRIPDARQWAAPTAL